MQKMKNLGSIGSSGRFSTDECEDEDVSKLAISTFQAKEEEIERRKMEVKERVELQLGRAEEETRRLAHIWEVSSLCLGKKDICDHLSQEIHAVTQSASWITR
jgi:hypothetical protein